MGYDAGSRLFSLTARETGRCFIWTTLVHGDHAVTRDGNYIMIAVHVRGVHTSVGRVTRAPRVYPRVFRTAMSYTRAERGKLYPTGIPYPWVL